MGKLFCDCKTDEEKSNFFLSGRAVETGIVAYSISNDVAMAYHRCAQFKKENDELRAKIEAMEQQEPVAWTTKLALEYGASRLGFQVSGVNTWGEKGVPLYALPGAQPAPSVPDGWKLVPIVSTAEMDNAGSDHCDGYLSTAQAVWDAMLAAAPEAKP